MISATIVGNLGADALAKQLDSGDSITEFNVACKVSFKKDAPPEWVRCSLWGTRGEKLRGYLVKGTKVVVRGALSARPYTPKAGGSVRAGLELRVDDLEFGSAAVTGHEGRAPSPPREPSALPAPPDDDIPF